MSVTVVAVVTIEVAIYVVVVVKIVGVAIVAEVTYYQSTTSGLIASQTQMLLSTLRHCFLLLAKYIEHHQTKDKNKICALPTVVTL